MNKLNTIEQEVVDKINRLKYLKFEVINNSYEVSLNDSSNYTIAKGYGNSVIEAINDLHHNLI